jgi:hypothetical protein
MTVKRFSQKSIPVKEKSGIGLTEREHERHGTPLDERIKSHPQVVARLLSQKKTSFPQRRLLLLSNTMNYLMERAIPGKLKFTVSTNS